MGVLLYEYMVFIYLKSLSLLSFPLSLSLSLSVCVCVCVCVSVCVCECVCVCVCVLYHLFLHVWSLTLSRRTKSSLSPLCVSLPLSHIFMEVICTSISVISNHACN